MKTHACQILSGLDGVNGPLAAKPVVGAPNKDHEPVRWQVCWTSGRVGNTMKRKMTPNPALDPQQWSCFATWTSAPLRPIGVHGGHGQSAPKTVVGAQGQEKESAKLWQGMVNLQHVLEQTLKRKFAMINHAYNGQNGVHGHSVLKLVVKERGQGIESVKVWSLLRFTITLKQRPLGFCFLNALERVKITKNVIQAGLVEAQTVRLSQCLIGSTLLLEDLLLLSVQKFGSWYTVCKRTFLLRPFFSQIIKHNQQIFNNQKDLFSCRQFLNL